LCFKSRNLKKLWVPPWRVFPGQIPKGLGQTRSEAQIQGAKRASSLQFPKLAPEKVISLEDLSLILGAHRSKLARIPGQPAGCESSLLPKLLDSVEMPRQLLWDLYCMPKRLGSFSHHENWRAIVFQPMMLIKHLLSLK